MNVIEWKGQRILTTDQLASSFNCDSKMIHNNFIRNKDRYTEGKHYFTVKGEELKEFKTNPQIEGKFKHSPVVYLWPEKGCWMHAKSVNTEEAWSAYEGLVDDYFKKVEEQKASYSTLSPTLQVLISLEQRQNAYEAKQIELQAENEELRKDMRHLSLVVDNEVWVTEPQKSDMRVAVNKRIGELKSQAIDGHFQGLYGDLKTFFQVSKYDKIARKDYEQAIEFIQGWFPKTKEKHS